MRALFFSFWPVLAQDELERTETLRQDAEFYLGSNWQQETGLGLPQAFLSDFEALPYRPSLIAGICLRICSQFPVGPIYRY